ncbi:hypothetical protein AB0N60_28925 [Streptomyces microflavus]|uniref:hypothetical protein n=1 Tax=Streptomyces microflavus TaxID=1919 RepID=UPI00333043CC
MAPRTAKGDVSVGKVWRWAAYGAVLVIAAAGCSDDGSNEPEQAVLSPSQVCDSTLKPSARTALARIGGTERYTELPGVQENGDPHRFSVSLAAKRLHSEFLQRSKCAVYKADGKNDFPLLDISFAPSSTVPGKDTEAGSKEVLYPLGEFASVNSKPGSTYATLFFACATKEPDGNSAHVKASLYVPEDQARPDSTPKDRMTVLNDVARALAEQLGCADEAALPAQVPEPAKG